MKTVQALTWCTLLAAGQGLGERISLPVWTLCLRVLQNTEQLDIVIDAEHSRGNSWAHSLLTCFTIGFVGSSQTWKEAKDLVLYNFFIIITLIFRMSTVNYSLEDCDEMLQLQWHSTGKRND